jgi:signal peptidase I
MSGGKKAILWLLLLLAVLAGVGYGVFVDTWTITEEEPRLNAALAPNASVGDSVLISRGTGARLGWLVRCADPLSADRYVVGRVIGTFGQELIIDRGRLTVNHHLASTTSSCLETMVAVYNPAVGADIEEYCSFEEVGSSRHATLALPNATETTFETRVQAGHVFLASDNRTLHYDSRDYGQVDPNTCQHIVFRVVGAGGWADSDHRLTFLY